MGSARTATRQVRTRAPRGNPGRDGRATDPPGRPLRRVGNAPLAAVAGALSEAAPGPRVRAHAAPGHDPAHRGSRALRAARSWSATRSIASSWPSSCASSASSPRRWSSSRSGATPRRPPRWRRCCSRRDHPGAHMLVMPADHIIGDAGAFRDAVGHGLRASEAGKPGHLRHRPDQPAYRLWLHSARRPRYRSFPAATRWHASSRSRTPRPRRRGCSAGSTCGTAASSCSRRPAISPSSSGRARRSSRRPDVRSQRQSGTSPSCGSAPRRSPRRLPTRSTTR